ncbi:MULTISPECIES: C40 family peptidase [Solibacillus]|uniref:C40 family peptidase n=1 Tax=Solibacillus merdavium TaxID=2762218 RepID=A0ABR8XHN6_9BACL|nr:C40 family peptidase [Solibacillus merdavium]MBD8031447.1 C40 family peptidase [Solibacillus merdavium]
MNIKWKVMLTGIVFSTAVLVAPTVEAAPSYSVKKGDTLTKIAKAHNTTINHLKQWNKLSEDRIYIAQKLVVTPIKNTVTTSGTSKVTAISVVEEKVEVPQKSFHTVVKGDNLTKIAKKYNISVGNLKQWNQLNSDAIKVGQKLAIEVAANKDLAVEAPTATNVEAVINFKQTADEAIEKQLSREVALPSTVSHHTEALYTQAIAIANGTLGTPYKYGGTTIEGFDCSGFVNFVFNSVGIPMDRKSSLMYFEQDTSKVVQPVPGDLVFFKNTFIPTISHMGIYLGNDEFIHAGSKGITISNINEKYWSERFVAYKRLNNLK